MAQSDPQYLTEALSNFLQAAQTKAQAQTQAEAAHHNHDPQAISRLAQENEALRDALAALQDRIDNGLAALGKEADEMQERLGTAEDSIVELTEHACQLGESMGGLEAAVRVDTAPVSAPAPVPAPAPAPAPAPGPKETARRRDAAPQNPRRRAFHAHYWAMRQKYHVQKPGKDHRAFIWSFIEGIDDKECAQYIQEYLMDEMPGKARRSKSPRSGRVMALSREIKWDDVKEAMAHLPEPPFWA